MYKKVITYTNYDGEKKTGTFYFNLTRPEMMEMKRSPLIEMKAIIDRIRKMDDPDKELTYVEKDEIQEKMGGILRDLVIQSYGVKSEDGESFTKRIGNRQFGAGEKFVESMAYDELYMEMISNVKNLINFVRAIVPESARNDLDNSPEFQASLRELESVQE